MIQICSDIIEQAAYEPLIGLASNYRYPQSLIVSPIKFGNDVKKIQVVIYFTIFYVQINLL